MPWEKYNPTAKEKEYLNEIWQDALNRSDYFREEYKKIYGEDYEDKEDWFSDNVITPGDKMEDYGMSIIQSSGPKQRGIREYSYCNDIGMIVYVREHYGGGLPTEWYKNETTELCPGIASRDRKNKDDATASNLPAYKKLYPNMPDDLHSDPFEDEYHIRYKEYETDDPDAAPSDSRQGKVLPSEIGGRPQILSATVQRWVRWFLAMEGGKKDTRILPSGGPAPIDPADPDWSSRRKALPPPPPYPTDPRRIRPADPDEFSGGVAGKTIMTLAKKMFSDIFAENQVMPSSTGPRPFDPISPEKRRSTMAPPKDWDPYGPRVKTSAMRLPDD